MIPACNDRIPLQASVIPTNPDLSAMAPPELCASIPSQCRSSVVTVATQRIKAAVIGCSIRAGHGTAVRKNRTGNASALAKSKPPRIHKITSVASVVSTQIVHKTISGCHICSRAHSSRNTRTPSPIAAASASRPQPGSSFRTAPSPAIR
jgi:hypothetical protein